MLGLPGGEGNKYLLLNCLETPVAVKIPLKNISVSEEETVTLSCKLNKPDKPVAWYKDGKVLKDGMEYQITHDNCEYSLKLPTGKASDAGNYTMKCGKAETSAKVVIKGENVIRLLLLPFSTIIDFFFHFPQLSI